MYKKIFIFTLMSLLTVGCMKKEFNDEASRQKVNENVESVFGITFDKNHDWCTTYSGVVEIKNVPATVKKVQILAHIYEDDAESLLILNEEDVKSSGTIKLNYDAPKDVINLYAAFISKGSYEVRKIEGSEVNFNTQPITRSVTRGYSLPSTELSISVIEDSYASIRGWIEGEKLYQMGDYSSQKMTATEYTPEYKELFRTIIFSYFKNGRKYNNLPLVIESGYYNENVYPITTGKDPIIVSPVYKNDGGYQEVVNSDLYYYYFKESDVTGDPAAYFESLPKYKAIPFGECVAGDDEITKSVSYALVYWGDGTPEIGTTGSYQFPEGYKIGFMVRAMCPLENKKKTGELYGDGRLNNYINFYDKCNFKSSNLGEDGPRMAWMTVNGRMFLCCESGTDRDFNDIILEVEGGVEPIIPIPVIESNSYTFCFEDREIGDYDMNDIVIKAKRLNSTQVEYSLVACGAYDKLFIKNIFGDVINDQTEIHELFGSDGGYVNTTSIDFEPVTETITVDANFSFLDENTQPYLYDATTGKFVKLSHKGEDPHGIMIPYDFRYPTEKTCIKDAYGLFNSWGSNMVTASDWYKYPKEDKVM